MNVLIIVDFVKFINVVGDIKRENILLEKINNEDNKWYCDEYEDFCENITMCNEFH